MEEGSLNETDWFCFYFKPNPNCSPLRRSTLYRIERICSASQAYSYGLFSAALVFGLPGSIFALILVGRLPLKPSTLYIRLLAASDFVALFSASLTYYKIVNNGDMTHSDDFLKWFGRIFQCFSHWLLVLICLERFVAIRYPLRKARLYTMQTTYLTCIAALFISSVHFILIALDKTKAIESDKYKFYVIMFFLSIYIFVPMLLIILFTTLATVEIRRSRGRRQTIVASGSSSLASKLEAEITRIMFLTALFFVLLTLPMLLYHLFDRIDSYWLHIELCPVDLAVTTLVFYICASLSYLNHAVNFYIYILGAPGFRQQFLILLCGKAREGTNTEATDVSQRS